MAVRLCLRVFKGDCLVGEHDFDRELIKIGRLASAHLPIDEPKASRIHAAIQAEASRLSVVDMGSPEGTHLNGKRVNRATVQIGDEVRIGETRIVIAEPRIPRDPPPPVPLAEVVPCVAPPQEVTVEAPQPAACEPVAAGQMPLGVPAEAEPQTTWHPADLDQAVGPVGLQVRYYWGDALLQVSQHGRPESVFLGETGRSELRLATDRFGGREFELLSRSEDGGFLLNLSDGMRGGLARDGERRALDHGSWPLGRGDFAWVEFAGIRAEVQFAPQPRPVAGRGVESLDVRFLNLLLGVTLAAGLFAVSAETRAEADVIADDLSAARLEYVKTVFTQASRPKPNPLLERMAQKPAAQPREAEAGERHKGREGKAGREGVRNEKGRGTVAAVSLDSSSIVKRSTLLDAVRQATGGVATVLGQGGLGGELKGTLAGISGFRAADVNGFGGLGARGNRPGGGGIGETVGIGGVSTAGRGGGVEDYGRDVGALAPKKPSGDPQIDDGGPPTIVGYDRELIRKVIRDNLSQVRFCYEEALLAHPQLSGRVVVRFVIDARGQVASAVIAEGSNLDDPGLELCLRSRVLAWQFAPPKGGGEAIVTYPFLFKPSGE